jgi:serine/threonine protein kinase
MTDTIDSSLYGKTLRIVGESTRGGQGIIWETNDPRVLVKQFEPSFIADDPRQQDELRRKAETVYKAFCAVNKGIQAELSCLPREYVTYRGNPAYLMQRAQGELLQSMLRQKKITPEHRLPLARALARAMRKLHASQIVHADVNPENFIAQLSPTGWIVFVLDIDGGGLLSPPGPVYPMSQPKRLYKAPELFAMPWKQLRERSLFFAPDAWALAVFLYQLLVDYEGPFCTVKTHPNPAVKHYVPFKPSAYRDTAVQWPLPWQKKLLRRAKLPSQIVSLFYETFGNRFALDTKPRPTAAQWEATLSRTTALLPVRHVYTLHGAIGWCKACAGTVRSLHPRALLLQGASSSWQRTQRLTRGLSRRFSAT